jgi:hypothetical protein
MLTCQTKGENDMTGIVATGTGVNLFVAVSLKHGLSLYAKTGMKPNRMWTPKAMMAKASEITGKKFKARDYQGAIAALQAHIDASPKDGITTY